MVGRDGDLWVVGAGGVDRATLDTAAEALADFPLDARAHPDPVGLDDFDGGEAPYHGLDLCGYATDASGRRPAVVVTDADIEMPDHGWTFGVSGVGADVAVVSTARLDSDGVDSAVEPRLRKEVRKHAGHLLGVGQCDDDSCVFSRSSSVWSLDRTDDDPCPACRARLDGDEPPEAATTADDAPPTTDEGSEPLWVVGVGGVDRSALDRVAAAARSTRVSLPSLPLSSTWRS